MKCQEKAYFVNISEKDTLDVWVNGQKMETAVSTYDLQRVDVSAEPRTACFSSSTKETREKIKIPNFDGPHVLFSVRIWR